VSTHARNSGRKLPSRRPPNSGRKYRVGATLVVALSGIRAGARQNQTSEKSKEASLLASCAQTRLNISRQK
jgi:hypothetical protein